MAYFIVIGTSNDVKCVVDEIKNAHLQHNVITSGCITSDENKTYYHWDTFNAKDEKICEDNASIALHDALTNQIAQFKTLLPDDAIPNVLIISNCSEEKDCDALKMVCNELEQIGGTKLSNLIVDIVLLGYDIKKAEDTTKRPQWRILKSLCGLEDISRFHTNILYFNNMDYMGAATNIDACILGKFLCHWSKVCSDSNNPKTINNSKIYSIGIAEHQYDLHDLNDFFKLSAEERLLDRVLNNEPSIDTQELLKHNYFKKIDLGLQWIDGLCSIKNTWETYCSTKWNPSKPLSENTYSVSRQKQELASYLNSFLKLYISEENKEISILKKEIKIKETELADPASPEREEQLKGEIEECQYNIKEHEKNIEKNTFIDANEFYERFGYKDIITEEDEKEYQSNFDKVGAMIEYVKTDAGIDIMREAISRARIIEVKDILPQSYPASCIHNVGRAEQIDLSQPTPTIPYPHAGNDNEQPKDRPGCLAFFKLLFTKENKETAKEPSFPEYEKINDECSKYLEDALNKTVKALKTTNDIDKWWKELCELTEKHRTRKEECKHLMDGEKDIHGNYINGKEGFRPKEHIKSVSLINMERVRSFRDTNNEYKQFIDNFLSIWFDNSVDTAQRKTMPQLIEQQILDPLRGKFHTLKWDGSNPFVKENITNEEIGEYINYNIRQSKPFVEYVLVQQSNIEANLNIRFYSNNKNINTDPNEFKKNYSIASNNIIPIHIENFTNSLCVIQVMDIPEHIEALKDFKPKRDYKLSSLNIDIKNIAATIIGNATTIKEKAKAIYKWLCDNIEYDTTRQIHDAETCWKTRRGVCQAYCELFCYMAEAVGLTADVIIGKTKNSTGKISDDKHAWVFVYTHAYNGILIDPTWGAGGIDGVKFVKSEDNSIWFDVSPYWMIFSHLPDNEYWTLLDLKVTEDDFRKLPYKKPSNKPEGKDLLSECLSKNSRESL